MSIPVFPPSREADLLAWSANFDQFITATPEAFGLTAAQATAYAALHAAFAAAYEVAIEPSTNSKSAINAKNVAKESLVNGPGGARQLVAIVQAFPGTTDPMRTDLGLKVRDYEPTPAPVPALAPNLSIVSSVGRTVAIRLRDASNSRNRGKPEGVQGAAVLTHVGETPPADPQQWALAFNTSLTSCDVVFPMSVPAGSKVWITSFWFNARKQSGPAAAAQTAVISDGLAQAA
jgi:hypothetical protein